MKISELYTYGGILSSVFFFFLLGSWSQPGFLQVNTSDSELMFQSSFVLEIEWQEPFV